MYILTKAFRRALHHSDMTNSRKGEACVELYNYTKLSIIKKNTVSFRVQFLFVLFINNVGGDKGKDLKKKYKVSKFSPPLGASLWTYAKLKMESER